MRSIVKFLVVLTSFSTLGACAPHPYEPAYNGSVSYTSSCSGGGFTCDLIGNAMGFVVTKLMPPTCGPQGHYWASASATQSSQQSYGYFYTGNSNSSDSVNLNCDSNRSH